MSSNLDYVDMGTLESITILDRVCPINSVEWSNPSRPLKGTATYSFGGDYEGYTMVVEFKRNMKNGKATAYSPRGVVFFEATYVDDVLNGEVVIRDERGAVLVDGMLHNGLREGVFTYKDEEDEYYYRGRQITQSSETDGYCLKNENGQLESVSQFTKDFSEIDGLSYEYEGGVLKRLCEYKQGKQVRLLREWNGAKMTEYNPQGKREYEGGFGGSLSGGFYRNGEGTEYHDDGRSILYDGHWSNGMRSGEGSWYKNTNGLPTYIGTWDNNVPNDEGALMDKNGKELYSGNWENGYLNVSGKKWVDFETGSVSKKGNKQRLKKWVERGGEEPEGCCEICWRVSCEVIVGLWDVLCFIVSGIWNGITWACEKCWEGISFVFIGLWDVLCSIVSGIWNGITWACEKCWEGISMVIEWIGENWEEILHCVGAFLFLCSPFLFGYSLSRYGWWGWSCPVFLFCFIGVLYLCIYYDLYPSAKEYTLSLILRCYIGAISIASYHLFGPMGTSGRKGAFITLIVLCSIGLIPYLIILYTDCDNSDNEYLYPDLMNMFSFISLFLVSSLFLSPWIIIAVVILRVVDFIFRDNELVFLVLPFIELIYLSIVVMLKHVILLVITVVFIVPAAVAELVHISSILPKKHETE